MKRLRRASVIVALYLLPWAATASAECAWVLWAEHEYRDDKFRTEKSWKLHVARPTQKECEEVLQRVWQVEVKNWQPSAERPGVKEVQSAPGLVIVTFKKGDSDYAGGFSEEFVCLPDTVDPRGPKPR